MLPASGVAAAYALEIKEVVSVEKRPAHLGSTSHLHDGVKKQSICAAANILDKLQYRGSPISTEKALLNCT